MARLKPLRSGTTSGEAAISALFENSPILVEVRFGYASPDWHLCQSVEEFGPILNRTTEGTPLYLTSVWDTDVGEKTLALEKRNPGGWQAR
jgi:hypothetical protein